MPKPESNEENKLKRKKYEKELRKLQAELCKLQDWVKFKGLRVIGVFEGRDAAGKGGIIRALTERVRPLVFRLVRCPHYRTATSHKCTCSATCNIFLPPEKSSFSTGAGTTAQV